MTKKNPIEIYAIESTLRSYNIIVEKIEELYGKGAAAKHPALVSTLLRFQEQMIRSTTELVVNDKISIENLTEFTSA